MCVPTLTHCSERPPTGPHKINDKLFMNTRYFVMKSNNFENIDIAKDKVGFIWSYIYLCIQPEVTKVMEYIVHEWLLCKYSILSHCVCTCMRFDHVYQYTMCICMEGVLQLECISSPQAVWSTPPYNEKKLNKAYRVRCSPFSPSCSPAPACLSR